MNNNDVDLGTIGDARPSATTNDTSMQEALHKCPSVGDVTKGKGNIAVHIIEKLIGVKNV